jgi:predicted N-formylglutamate amidohydrolase
MAETPLLLLTCEHAGNRIPRAYASLFRGCRRLLAGHRGYDFGALACARGLRRRLQAPLLAGRYSRLLVDLNRSPAHPALFSERTRALSRPEKERLLARHYHPHRQEVEGWIRARVAAGGTVVHVAVHSFTPVLDGVARRADIGLLYDPARRSESALCRRWRAALRDAAGAGLVVRRNYPYRGVSDGLTRYLRTRFAAARYAGIELEINQRLLRNGGAPRLVRLLATALQRALAP